MDKCQVNLTNQRMRIIWMKNKLPISRILAVINEIGYDAKPYRQDTHEAMLARHNNKMLLRLGIAALGAMQAMMYAVALYTLVNIAICWSFSATFCAGCRYLSARLFSLCWRAVFPSAWSAIRARQVNMDVPVSVALIVTFFASMYATVTGQGRDLL